MTRNAVGMLERIRLEKSATDAGFDVLQQDAGDGWTRFASTSCPLRISLTVIDAQPVAALSMANVLSEISTVAPSHVVVPSGSAGVLIVSDFSELQAVLARAYDLAKALPNALLSTWRATVNSVTSTEREATVLQRVGQELFRKGLLSLWQGRCALTGLAIPALLRASHAKPWRDATDEERLDVFNGLLLTAHLDAAFDAGLIGFSASGRLLISPRLNLDDVRLLGLERSLPLITLRPQHVPYLDYHRNCVFLNV